MSTQPASLGVLLAALPDGTIITVLRPSSDEACPHDLVVRATISGGVYTIPVVHYTCQRCRLKVEVPAE